MKVRMKANEGIKEKELVTGVSQLFGSHFQ
jgi:hypothetical protein